MPHRGGAVLLSGVVLAAVLPGSSAQQATEISSTRVPAVGAETVRVRVQLVLVPVRVESKQTGRMSAGDFRLLVDGREQPVRIFEAETQQIDVAVILDTSASTAGDLPMLKKAAEKFMARFAPSARIALYQTGQEVVKLAGFSTQPQVLKAGLRRLTPSLAPGSKLYDAIATAEAAFPENGRRRAIVIFSDAVDEDSKMPFPELQRRLLRANTPIYAVVTRERPEPREWDATKGQWAIVFDLASSSSKNVARLREASIAMLDQLHPNAQVMVCDFQRYVRRLRSPAHLQGQVPDMWSSPAAAREIVRSMVGTNQYARLGNFDEYCNAQNLVVLTDRNRTGLTMLRHRIPLERASILAPVEHEPGDLSSLLELMVRRRAETARYLWEQSRQGHQRMASLVHASGGEVTAIDRMEQLGRAYDQIFDELQQSYLLGYYHSAEPGDYRLEVETPHRTLTLHSRTRVLVD